MIIDERIYQLLVPAVLPSLYPMIAPDKAPPPYTTYLLLNAQNLTTHDTPLPATRMWHLQFSTYSASYFGARIISNSIQDSLVGYTDPFILGVTCVREQGAWDDIAKLFGWTIELL